MLTPFSLVWGTSVNDGIPSDSWRVSGSRGPRVAWRGGADGDYLGALALVAGLIGGMLVKPTTAIFWVAPALGYRPNRRIVGVAERPRTPGVDSDSRSVADRSSAPLDAACRRDQSGESDDRLADE